MKLKQALAMVGVGVALAGTSLFVATAANADPVTTTGGTSSVSTSTNSSDPAPATSSTPPQSGDSGVPSTVTPSATTATPSTVSNAVATPATYTPPAAPPKTGPTVPTPPYTPPPAPPKTPHTGAATVPAASPATLSVKADVVPIDPYVDVVWLLGVGSTSANPFVTPQTIVSHAVETTKTFSTLPPTCGATYQEDIYVNDSTTAALIAGGVLNASNSPKESFPAGGSSNYRIVANDACVATASVVVPAATCDMIGQPADASFTAVNAVGGPIVDNGVTGSRLYTANANSLFAGGLKTFTVTWTDNPKTTGDACLLPATITTEPTPFNGVCVTSETNPAGHGGVNLPVTTGVQWHPVYSLFDQYGNPMSAVITATALPGYFLTNDATFTWSFAWDNPGVFQSTHVALECYVAPTVIPPAPVTAVELTPVSNTLAHTGSSIDILGEALLGGIFGGMGILLGSIAIYRRRIALKK